MAKVKMLSDKIVINSKILTDQNLRKVALRCPSCLVLKDEEEKVFEVGYDSKSSMTQYGVLFNDGKVEATLKGNHEDAVEFIKNVLSMINEVEENVSDFLKVVDAADKKLDIEVMD